MSDLRCANPDCCSPRVDMTQLGEGTMTYFCLDCGAEFNTPAHASDTDEGTTTHE